MNPDPNAYSTQYSGMGQPAPFLQPPSAQNPPNGTAMGQPAPLIQQQPSDQNPAMGQQQPEQEEAPKKTEYRSRLGEKCGMKCAITIIILVVMSVVGFPMLIAGIVVYFVSNEATGTTLMIVVAVLTFAALSAVFFVWFSNGKHRGRFRPNTVKPENASSAPPSYDQSVNQPQPVTVHKRPQPGVLYEPTAPGGQMESPQQPHVYLPDHVGTQPGIHSGQPGMHSGQPNPGLYPNLPPQA